MREGIPSRAMVELLQNNFAPGTVVELLYMSDPYTKLKAGDLGVVRFVDDMGTIFCEWDNGEGLGLVYGADMYRIVSKAKESDKIHIDMRRSVGNADC